MITLDARKIIQSGIEANPFPGLRPFEYHENHLFFGREGQNQRLIEKLHRTRFLAVVGTSGSGKSSLVGAGLLPTLLGGFMPIVGSFWRVALLRPGNDPLGNLARALNSRDAFGDDDDDNRSLQIALTEATLRGGNLGLIEAARQAHQSLTENLLVIADQFEELFRVEKNTKNKARENDKAEFIRLLLAAAQQRKVNIYVVLTMRSDYLGECSQFQDLPEAINESQYLIPRLTQEQLRQAITNPVAVGGAAMTPRLVHRLLKDIGDKQDQLPLLQHALMRTWDEWKAKQPDHARTHQGEAIDVCCYEQIGGMAAALSKHADQAYLELPDDRAKFVAERMFKCLTEKGTSNREVRRSVTLREICAIVGAADDNTKPAPIEEVVEVINTFRASRRSFLMPPAGTPLDAKSLIDISHESLIRNWERLRAWVEEEAESARRYLRLAETAKLFQAGQAGLLRDTDLHFALDWQQKQQPREAWAQQYFPAFAMVMGFLEKSRADEQDRKAKAKAKDRQALRRARLVGVVLFLAFLVSLAATIFAFQQRREAINREDYAVGQEEKAKNKENEANVAKRDALLQQCIAQEERAKAVVSENSALAQKEIAEQKKNEAIASAIEARKQKRQADEDRKTAEAAQAVAENAKNAADMSAFSAKKEKERAEEATRRAEAEKERAEKGKREIEDYRKFENLSAQIDKAQLYRTQNPSLATVLAGSAITSLSALQESALDDKEKRIGEIQKRGWSELQQVLPMTMLSQRFENDEWQERVAFAADGSLITLTADGKGKIWQPWGWEFGSVINKTSPQPFSLEPDFYKNTTTRAKIKSIAVSPDGTYLAIGQNDGLVKYAKLAELQTAGQSSPSHLLPKSQGHAINRITFGQVAGQAPLIATSSVSWTSVVTRIGEKKKLWKKPDPISRLILDNFNGTRRVKLVTAMAFSPCNEYLAIGRDDGAIELRDTRNGQLLLYWEGHQDEVTGVVFHPQEKLLATVGKDKLVKVWEISPPFRKSNFWGIENRPANPTARNTLAHHTSALSGVAFSSDGKLLLTVGDDQQLAIWDMRDQPVKLLLGLTAHVGRISSVAFNTSQPQSGYQIVTTGVDDKSVRVWNLPALAQLVEMRLLLQEMGRMERGESYQSEGQVFSQIKSFLSPKLSGDFYKYWEGVLNNKDCRRFLSPSPPEK